MWQSNSYSKLACYGGNSSKSYITSEPTTKTNLNYPIYTGYLLHKISYKHRYLAASSKCFTKPFLLLLTKKLTALKLQEYCVVYSRRGIKL